MAELLFAHGMDPDRPNWMRATPLHHFANNGDIEGAALYLDHGANIEAEDAEWRSTPLARAAEAGRTRMVEYLFRRGARVDPIGGPAWAKPIAWAERRGHTEVVELLREYVRSATLPTRTLADYEALANDLVRAYGGDAASLDRIVEYFRIHRPLRWDRPPTRGAGRSSAAGRKRTAPHREGHRCGRHALARRCANAHCERRGICELGRASTRIERAVILRSGSDERIAVHLAAV